MEKLLEDISACTYCRMHLPFGPNPILKAHPQSRIVLISQAPGRVAHRSGVPWDDRGGHRLRDWLGVDRDAFFDPRNFAVLPMAFCYPGKGPSGDRPPRPECAPLWHRRVLEQMPNLRLTLLLGAYAQAHYLGDRRRRNLTETVRNYAAYLPEILPLPHPSPRNNIWLRKNPWFVRDLLPELRARVRGALVST